MPRRASCLALLAACLLAAPLRAAEPPKKDKKGVNDKIKEVAGSAEFLRSVPKHFATLKAVDLAGRRVTLLIEGEKLAKVWPLAPDAELKVSGWWGRLDQFTAGDLLMSTVLRIEPELLVEPRLTAYVERCTARPAFERALAAQMADFRDAA